MTSILYENSDTIATKNYCQNYKDVRNHRLAPFGVRVKVSVRLVLGLVVSLGKIARRGVS